jgi:hypothetical protein
MTMWDDDDEPAEPTFESALVLLRRFGHAAERVRWFAGVGMPFDSEIRAAARAYLDNLGFPDAEIAQVSDFAEAAAAAESLDWDSSAWEVEEGLRADLTEQASAIFGEEILTDILLEIRARVGAAARIGADEAAALYDEADEALINAAVGGAIQACHQAALVLAAGAEGDHPFVHKFRLFEAGRWPVGLTGTSLNLF